MEDKIIAFLIEAGRKGRLSLNSFEEAIGPLDDDDKAYLVEGVSWLADAIENMGCDHAR